MYKFRNQHGKVEGHVTEKGLIYHCPSSGIQCNDQLLPIFPVSTVGTCGWVNIAPYSRVFLRRFFTSFGFFFFLKSVFVGWFEPQSDAVLLKGQKLPTDLINPPPLPLQNCHSCCAFGEKPFVLVFGRWTLDTHTHTLLALSYGLYNYRRTPGLGDLSPCNKGGISLVTLGSVDIDCDCCAGSSPYARRRRSHYDPF